LDATRTDEPGWAEPPLTPALPSGEVHVWRVELSASPAELERLASLLSVDERARSERFRSSADRARYVVAHTALRAILGRYLGVAPGEVRFTSERGSKPRLATATNATDLRFSLAHAGQLALYAVARGRKVGVDLEHLAARIDPLSVARSSFAEQEYQALSGTSAEKRRAAFFQAWTYKEAYLKATGLGLARSMDSFAVSFTDAEPPRLLWVRDQPEETGRWSLVPLAPHPEYAAALAAEGHDWRLFCWHLGRE
jgi:4'-phosphopantetheinyl transferase